MKKNYTVSVVIPTHNRAHLLERAINSVLNQTYEVFEIIVVSDGSQDNTDAVMAIIQEKDKKVKYYSYSPARGANHARNVGIDNARGEIVGFLDDDDEWVSDKIEKQINIIKSDENIGMVCGGLKFVYVDQNNRMSQYIPNPPEDCSKLILIQNIVGGTPSVIVNKGVLVAAGMFDENLKALQDYDLWIRIAKLTHVGVLKEPCVICYDQMSLKKISNNTENYIKSIEIIKNKYSEDYKQLTVPEIKLRDYNFNVLIAKKLIRNGTPQLGRKYLAKAFQKVKTTEIPKLWLASWFSITFIVRIKTLLSKM